MSRRTRKPTRARIAALLTAPVLGVGLLAPSAFADAPPPGPKSGNSGVLNRICEHAREDDEGSQGLSCERDIAPIVSRFLGPGISCMDQSETAIVCRPQT
ncbi:hypothetical protein J2Z21_003669 [Streptomyces griseochromogenes]|uniref:Uncharacterized protein n=1 Tax=Streptomyces griseochromogenes TaxID=68214 RepID=A0A1B1AP36_9ACTN|nr:hypothetical protein [Streptomyces griseochromogenes]ANP48337.1 hypothetical protein AVL59_00990 [Streptomyces griseochromogenes]MBP2050719.1 hypothetical protein [Streptomyces griseochromogenes]